VQLTKGEHVELAYVDQGYTGNAAEEAAAKHGIRLEVVKHTKGKPWLSSAATAIGMKRRVS
jgi:hypothetical protein